jgi:Tol biopolymer transport system component
MRRPTTSALLLLAACGARLSDGAGERDLPDAESPTDAQAIDAAADAAPLGPWSLATKVLVASTIEVEDDVTLSSNALEMIFAITDADTDTKDLYYTSRSSMTARWGTVAKLPFDLPSSEETPRFSGDDRTLYFASDRAVAGDLDIYMVSYSAAGSTRWGQPQPVPGLDTSATEKWFTPCGSDRYVVVRSTADNDTDLFEGTLGGGPPRPLDILNSPDTDTGAFLTQDCLTIYFASTRVTPEKIFVSHRTTVDSPWDRPMPVDDFKITGGSGNQEDPWLSADGRTFAFASDIAADNKDIYLSTR